ncbi:MAG: hypothetical protein A3I43_04135 [Omnitrophica WOR_2 bacterium RIFCSPLOWO2_02_FULL_50_19]|nr:MAG: hypothetical protein A3I43_04135 [Omnitrophica WOR_2 bacterium RIFCSPLOWO2_02_FULL_50_19]
MLCGSVWSITFRMIVKYPRVLLPFFIKAVFEALALTVFFYSPRPPFSIVFAQPIKSFFDAKFLHYPNNFSLLPTLFYYGQIFVMVTFGVIMYGMAMGMVSQAHSEDGEVKIFGNFNRSVRRYFALIGIWLIAFMVSLVISKVPPVIIKKLMQPTPSAILLLQIVSYIGIVLVFAVEAFFIYAYPAIIIERKGFFGAIKRSFNVIRHVFLTTFILIFVPRLIEFLYMFVKQKQQGLMNLTVPEITLVILGVGIFLAFVADALVFLSTANLFILKQETEKGV